MTKPIECPVCEWPPDGEEHWQCTCGHAWNTFDTKGKCPSCNFQWEETYCPACGQTSPHNDWYSGAMKPGTDDGPETIHLKIKKKKLEARLISLGIKNYRIGHLPYLDHTKEEFQNPYDVGCRLVILSAISYSVHKLENRLKIIHWLKIEELWDKVSEKEKEFFTDQQPTEETRIALSWRLESALVLGWALDLIDNIHSIDNEGTDDEINTFMNYVPELGESTKEFLSNVSYRSLEEIYEENLLNEMATTYFRDLLFNGKEDETQINRAVSFERHYSLNWVRKFSGISEWDETDTST
ncbi:MAG: DUF4272 domain-containing protein [Bacteroidota bacterium]|nr:DUF4272 domain-containing protein [Bacteroidota bacterium]